MLCLITSQIGTLVGLMPNRHLATTCTYVAEVINPNFDIYKARIPLVRQHDKEWSKCASSVSISRSH